MQVFHRLPCPSSRIDCALTIGNFDGVHRGHQSVLKRLAERAGARGLPVSVLSFEPHPREYFAQAARGRAQANQPAATVQTVATATGASTAPTASTPVRIQGLRDKVAALSAAGVHRLVLARFNQAMAALSAEDFVRDVLIDALRVRELIVGDDFRFGRDRRGDFAMLQKFAREGAFNLSRTETLADHEGRISSSAVRKALADGDLSRVRDLLGRPYTISGHVLHGRKLGRELGFPTLNLRVAGLKPALSGIFVVQVHGLASQALPGVASLGTRPAVEQNGRFLLETHVFDFSQTVYGRVVRVEFMAKLRDEANYPTLELLRAQIDQDAEQARTWFEQHPRTATRASAIYAPETINDHALADCAHRPTPTPGAAPSGDSLCSDNLPSRVL
jgi:riboflavin kinase/FMN adenylyltransferase